LQLANTSKADSISKAANRLSNFIVAVLDVKQSSKLKLFYKQFSTRAVSNDKKINTMQLRPEKNKGNFRILVAPLDWGLGHATRCIPIIREQLAKGCEVWLAGERAQEALLKEEFPGFAFLRLEGYRMQYSKSGAGMFWSMLRQSGKIIRAIKKENEWLKKAVAEYHFDAVISDNRYGLYHSSVPCIFITHQLTVKSPLGKWSEGLLQKINYKYISRFTACWVPDEEGGNNLAGELSHPGKLPRVPVSYTGYLSRFIKKQAEQSNHHLLIVLSGPEPQRTILENIIVKQIAFWSGTATVVRGLPGSAKLIPSTNTLKFYNHLPAGALNDEMLKAAYIISRSGYSTVMDIASLQKKSILIPTPGQTEQEYLAKYLMQKGFAVCMNQKGFLISEAIQKAKQFNYKLPATETRLEEVVAGFIQLISDNQKTRTLSPHL
jgi:uncharacterized protein (TIGR00661 family)